MGECERVYLLLYSIAALESKAHQFRYLPSFKLKSGQNINKQDNKGDPCSFLQV